MDNLQKLNVAHVGGRAGSTDFPKNKNFNDSINYIIFEPDEDCIDQIKKTNPNDLVYSYCLDKNNKKRKFYINKNRYSSSFLKPNSNELNIYEEIQGNIYKEIQGSDMLYSEATKVEKVLNLNTYSIDFLVSNKKINNIDFISLDTQGSELDILIGSEKQLTENIVAVKVEVSFVKLYKDSALFKDIDDFLISKGFFLAELSPFENVNFGQRIPKSFRGKKISKGGEALYFLDPNKIKINNNFSYQQKLQKLAFVAVTYGYIDLAYLSLDLIKCKHLNLNNKNSFQNFLYQFYTLIHSSKEPLPDLWHENLDFNYSINVSHIDKSVPAEYFNKNFFQRALTRLFSDPKKFVILSKYHIKNKLFKKIIKRHENKGNKNFIYFLNKYDMHYAIQAVKSKK